MVAPGAANGHAEIVRLRLCPSARVASGVVLPLQIEYLGLVDLAARVLAAKAVTTHRCPCAR
eukprot:2345345-Pyramimonas_sp.AAC.1